MNDLMEDTRKRFTQKILEVQEAFAVEHFDHDVHIVQPCRMGYNGPSWDGFSYVECLDCNKRSNGKDLKSERTETGLRVYLA